MPRCVLVLELCTFTSHISLHSSLPASSELAIVQRCTEESKQEGCFAPVWGRGAERKERMKKWSRHLCQVHQSVISLPGFAKVKGNKKLNLAQLRQKPLKANETPDSQCPNWRQMSSRCRGARKDWSKEGHYSSPQWHAKQTWRNWWQDLQQYNRQEGRW